MKRIHVDNIIKYTYYALLFFLPLSIFMDNVALILLVIATLTQKMAWPHVKRILWSSLILLFIYILFLGVVNFKLEIDEYIKLLPLMLLPLVLFHLSKDTMVNGLYFLFAAIIIQQIIAVYGIFDYYLFTEGKTVALRSYAGINDILRFERPYLGFFSALNIIIAYLLFQNTRVWIFLVTTVFSLIIIAVISARLGLGIALMTLLTIMVSKVRLNRKYWLLTIGFIVIVSTIFFAFNNPLKNRFQQLKYDTRIVVWEGALKLFETETNIIFGIKSQSEIESRLLDFYKNDAEFDYPPDRLRFIRNNYNTHNQYINEILRGGLIGLSLLMLPFCVLIYHNMRRHRLEMVLLLISILLFLLVENLLARQMGVYSIAIILSLSSKLAYEKD